MRHIAWIGLLGLLSAGALSAETRMRVNVPFDFIAADKALPAGDYRVEVDSVSNRVTLSALSAPVAVIVPSHITGRNVGSVDATKLLFNQYGKTTFLRAVWQAGQSSGYEVTPSHHEKEMAKRFVRVEVASVRK